MSKPNYPVYEPINWNYFNFKLRQTHHNFLSILLLYNTLSSLTFHSRYQPLPNTFDFVVCLTLRDHTYVHKWSLQNFSEDNDSSQTTYYVCVNFIHECWDLQFKRQIFEKLFIAILFHSQKSAGRKSPKKFFHIFILMSDLANTYIHTRLRRLQLVFDIYICILVCITLSKNTVYEPIIWNYFSLK